MKKHLKIAIAAAVLAAAPVSSAQAFDKYCPGAGLGWNNWVTNFLNVMGINVGDWIRGNCTLPPS